MSKRKSDEERYKIINISIDPFQLANIDKFIASNYRTLSRSEFLAMAARTFMSDVPEFGAYRSIVNYGKVLQ